MDKRVLRFLAKQRVCSLSVLLKDGSPHSAAMHYSNSERPLEIYMQTRNTTKKSELLSKGGSVKASIVVGFSEDEFVTLQMDGEIGILPESKRSKMQKIHYQKHPDAEKRKDDPATIFLVFKPIWYRYTEYKPKFKVISSDLS